MDEPFGGHMTLPVCLLLLFRREGSGLRVGARGPLGQGAIFEHSGASSFPVRSGMSTSTVAVSVSTLSLSLSLCSGRFVDLVHLSSPPPIVLRCPEKWCHGRPKSIQEVFKAEWLQYTLFCGLWLLFCPWKAHPADLGAAATGLEPLSSRLPVHSLPDPRGQGALPSPPPQGLGQKPAPDEGREAGGLGGQREFPQKNRGTGLSGEPRSPSPALGWDSRSV